MDDAAGWNSRHPSGTSVLYRGYKGAIPFPSKTRSEAWELGDGSPVVLIEGKSGGVALDALEVTDG